MGTVKIKTSHPSQGKYIVIDENDFDPKTMQRALEEERQEEIEEEMAFVSLAERKVAKAQLAFDEAKQNLEDANNFLIKRKKEMEKVQNKPLKEEVKKEVNADGVLDEKDLSEVHKKYQKSKKSKRK